MLLVEVFDGGEIGEIEDFGDKGTEKLGEQSRLGEEGLDEVIVGGHGIVLRRFHGCPSITRHSRIGKRSGNGDRTTEVSNVG